MWPATGDNSAIAIDRPGGPSEEFAARFTRSRAPSPGQSPAETPRPSLTETTVLKETAVLKETTV